MNLKELLEAKREKKSLGEVAVSISRGVGITKNELGTGEHPCTTYGSISHEFCVWFDKCNYKVDIDLLKNPKFFEYGDLLMVTSSQLREKVGECCAYVGDEKGIAGSALFIVKHKQNPKYLAYALSTTKARAQRKRLVRMGPLNNINKEDIKKIEVPLPSLDVQEKIVSFLDNLRDLTNRLIKELEEELRLRKEQYEYYLNKLVEECGGEIMNLGEIITEIYRGTGVTNEQLAQGGEYPCTTYGSISNAFSIWFEKCNFLVSVNAIAGPRFFEYGDLLMVTSSQSLSKVGDCCAYLGEDPGIAGGALFILRHEQNAKYLAYALATREAKQQKQALAHKGAVNNLNTSSMKKIKVPIPSWNDQEDISEKLDELRFSCEELEKIIPREIELLNKLYEYYRDLLIDV